MIRPVAEVALFTDRASPGYRTASSPASNSR